jgi:hypothetical protein
VDKTKGVAVAPREVSLALNLRLHLGGIISWVGWGVFLFGYLMCWIFGVGTIIASLTTFSGSMDYADGMVVNTESTSASTNDERVMKMDYVFESEGKEYRGSSFATGQFYEEGSKVPIEYSFLDPRKSRIVGLRSSTFSSGILFVTIFPLMGLIVVVVGFLLGHSKYTILKNGQQAMARLIETGPSNITVNDVQLTKLTFEFKTDDGESHRTSTDVQDPSELEDDAEEALLCHPKTPSRSVMLNNLPSFVHLSESGNFTTESGPLSSLFLPAIALAVIVLSSLV